MAYEPHMQKTTNYSETLTLLENVLLSHIKKFYFKGKAAQSPWNKKDTQYFAKGIIALNKSFTSNRSGKFMNYFNDPVMRSGYLSYFLPVNAMKTFFILQKYNTISSEKRIRIADVGSGPLTLSFGFLMHLAEQLKTSKQKIQIDIHAYELNKYILKDGEQLLKKFIEATHLKTKVKLNLKTIPIHLMKEKIPNEEYDYIFMGNFLNEFEKRVDQIQIVQKIFKYFTHASTKIFFLEPGSKKISRDLQALRDDILENSDVSILGPCLHHKECPLNHVAKSDWCNFNQTWQAPKFIRDFDAITKLKKEYLLYSFLFLQKGKRQKSKHNKQDFIAISNTMKAKSKKEVIGCGVLGRIRFIKPTGQKSKINDDFEFMKRGQLFQTNCIPEDLTFTFDKSVTLKKIHRFQKL